MLLRMIPFAVLTLALSALFGASPQAQFEPVSSALEFAESVSSPKGVEYSIREGRLFRDGTPLGSASEEGTGAVHSLGVHLGGTVFVAAEHGLFRVSDEVAHTDLVKLHDGGPTGVPIGALPRGLNRVWFATLDSFGCLDSRQFFGRTFRESDGLPPGPYLGLAEDETGALLLETTSGVHRYQPALGDRPVARVVSVQGNPHAPGRVYSVDASGDVELGLEGDAVGGATFRYRGLHHHLWYPLDKEAPRITALEPGRHTLLIAAYDRNLRRSDAVRVDVEVAYPEVFDKRVLIPIALLGCLLVLVGWVFAARRSGGGAVRYGKAFISSFLSVAIGLQLIVGVIPHARSWPFIGYTMFTERYAKNGVTFKQTLYGIDRNRERIKIQRFDAAYGLGEFRRDLAPVIHGNAEKRSRFLAKLNEPFKGDRFKGFLILDERNRLTENGPIEVAPTVLCVHPRKALVGR